MLDAVTQYGEQQKAKVVLVHPKIREPKPLWARRLSNFETRILPTPSSERRGNTHWEDITNVELEYTIADWGLPPTVVKN
jgi:hypothetical protein